MLCVAGLRGDLIIDWRAGEMQRWYLVHEVVDDVSESADF